MDNKLKSQLSFIDSLSNIENEKPKQYVLRDYQKEAVKKGVDHLLSGKKPGVIIVPSGGGKSLIIANIAKSLKGHTLLLQPTKEILQQNYDKLMSYNINIDVGIYSASFSKKDICTITFCTIGSVYKKPILFQHFEYIIIDECHVVSNDKTMMYNKFITSLGNKPLIGLTATPFRTAVNSYGFQYRFLTRQNPRIFLEVIYFCQVDDLYKQGFLATCKYYRVNNGFDSTLIRLNSNGTDFLDSSIKKYYADVKFDNTLLDVVKRLVNVGRKSILVFTKFVEEAMTLSNDLGDISRIVTGKTPKEERDTINNKFRNGDIKIIVNVGVYVVGVDFPELDTVVIGKPSRSLIFWYQAVCRGIRPFWSKQETWIVDLCDNLNTRFPPVTDLHLTKDDNGQWIYINKVTKEQVTNIYLSK